MATLYYVIYTSEKADPSAAQIKTGQDALGGAATAAGNEVARTTTGVEYFTTPASGLTAGTSYKVAFVWSDGTSDSAVSVSAAWSTTATETYTYSPTGSVTFEGTATTLIVKNYGYTGTGYISFSGSAATTSTSVYSYIGGGSLTIDGSASVYKTTSLLGSGDVEFSGVATTGYTPGSITYSYIPSGLISFNSSAAISTEFLNRIGGGRSKDKSKGTKKQYLVDGVLRELTLEEVAQIMSQPLIEDKPAKKIVLEDKPILPKPAKGVKEWKIEPEVIKLPVVTKAKVEVKPTFAKEVVEVKAERTVVTVRDTAKDDEEVVLHFLRIDAENRRNVAKQLEVLYKTLAEGL